MLRRLFVGLVEGLVIGISLAVAAALGLGLRAPGALSAALLAGIAGFVVGLVAGRPIWARDAKTEALLKAGVGALVGVGLSFALGRWLSIPLDLGAYSFGAGPAGKLLAVPLPLVSSALSLFFELDNTGGSNARPRLSAPGGKQRFNGGELDEAMSNSALDSLEDLPAERKHEKR